MQHLHITYNVGIGWSAYRSNLHLAKTATDGEPMWVRSRVGRVPLFSSWFLFFAYLSFWYRFRGRFWPISTRSLSLLLSPSLSLPPTSSCMSASLSLLTRFVVRDGPLYASRIWPTKRKSQRVEHDVVLVAVMSRKTFDTQLVQMNSLQFNFILWSSSRGKMTPDKGARIAQPTIRWKGNTCNKNKKKRKRNMKSDRLRI